MQAALGGHHSDLQSALMLQPWGQRPARSQLEREMGVKSES